MCVCVLQNQQVCDEIIVLHLGYLNYTQYHINISFRSLDDLKDNIKNVTFVVRRDFLHVYMQTSHSEILGV